MKNLISRIYAAQLIVLVILMCVECKKTDTASSYVDSLENNYNSVEDSLIVSFDSTQTAPKDSVRASADSQTASNYDSTESSYYPAQPLDNDRDQADYHIIKPQLDTLIMEESLEDNLVLIDDIRANTAIYAPKEMTKNQTYTVFAMLSLKEMSYIKKRIMEHANKLNHEQILESDVKYAKTTFSTDKIKVSLKCDNEIFEIIDSDNGIIKTIDENNDEILWKWNIKAENYSSKSPLIFIFQSVDNNEVIFEEQFDVDVNVSVKNTFGGYFHYLADEPKYTIPSIILPLITLLYGIFLRKRKAAKEENL